MPKHKHAVVQDPLFLVPSYLAISASKCKLAAKRAARSLMFSSFYQVSSPPFPACPDLTDLPQVAVAVLRTY